VTDHHGHLTAPAAQQTSPDRGDAEGLTSRVEPKLTLRGIKKSFKARDAIVEAVQGVDLAVERGEFVTIVGPSGCGKSTLLMIAAGLEKPSAGQVLVDGKPAGPPGPNRCVVFQRFALFPAMTVRKNVEFGLRMAHVGKAERERRAAEQLAMVGLAGFEGAYPHELSGGMQQRVAIARALVLEPDILLMDEPFGALDAQTRGVMQEQVGRICRDLQLTTLFITHSVEEAVYLGHRVVVMTARPGRIKEEIPVPVHADWRGLSVEDASGRPDFGDLRTTVWSLVKEELKEV
jgi:NitT/TauT family transport system ATP-binding protein